MSLRADGRVIVVGTLLALCSSGPFYVVPDYLAALQKAYGFSVGQLGYVSGIENLMILIACVATGFALSRLGRRTMIAAALICVIGNVLTMFATDYPVVLAVRALTGLLGEGPLYAMSYAVLGSALNPDRAFGIGVGGVAVGAALILAMETALDGLFGPAAVLVPYAVIALILTAVTAWTRQIPRADIAAEAPDPAVYLRAGAIILSIILWSSAAGAFWAFTGTAAGVLGVREATISQALTIALLVGLAALVVPVLLGNLFGRIVPLFIATAGLVISCFLFFEGGALPQIAVALSLLQFCWDIAAVYQLAGIATVDRSGRFSAFGAVGQIAGMALGPAISGMALGRFGYGFMPPAVAGIAVVAFLLFLAGARGPAKISEGPIPAVQ